MNSLSQSVKELRNLEIYCLVGTGAVWTWAASSYESFTLPIIWWIPFPLIIFGWISTMATRRSIDLNAEYLRKIEKEVELTINGKNKQLLHWQNFFEHSATKYNLLDLFKTENYKKLSVLFNAEGSKGIWTLSTKHFKAVIANQRAWFFWGGLSLISFIGPFFLLQTIKPKTSDEKKDTTIPVVTRVETPKPMETPIVVVEIPVITHSNANQQ
ncbi:MAG: hypothetical protein IPJ55_16565 [Chloracidobacterium sp.]|nr:hypothetical protein [Chloracidobacterium sp.]